LSILPQRFKHLDLDYHPYLQNVLIRLPPEIRAKILFDPSFQIIGTALKDFDHFRGLYIHFNDAIRHLFFITAPVLNKPEYHIIYSIAHEIAHYIAGEGTTGMREKEADYLLSKWGFEEEIKKAKHFRAIAQSIGYKAGYKWAKGKDDDFIFHQFGGFYDEWDDKIISVVRLEELRYIIDIPSILSTFYIGESTSYESRETMIEDMKDMEVVDAEEGFLERGVVYGIMSSLKERKIKRGIV
jgi:hypothetical protein